MKTSLAFLALPLVLLLPAEARQRSPRPAGDARQGPGQAAATLDLADFDGDGRRDLAVLSPAGVLKLFRNSGDGRFDDETALAGLAGVDGASFVLWQDFDGDQRSDLLVGALRGPRRLFRNLGDGTFEDVAGKLGLAHTGADRSAQWLDADGDGRLDLFVEGSAGARLHRALGDGTFEEQVLAPAVPGLGLAGSLVPPPEPEDRSGVASDDAGARSGASATSTSTSTSGLPAPGRPERAGMAGGGRELHEGCASWIQDALHPGSCLQASSVPMRGMLFPPPHDGGVDNIMGGEDPFLGGGRSNRTDGIQPTIAGGRDNTATGHGSAIGGGFGNSATGDHAAIAGGHRNGASGHYASISGGWLNTSSGALGTVGGGRENEASGGAATIAGGHGNDATGSFAVVAGGFYNRAEASGASVGGGSTNRAAGEQATIAGGLRNSALGAQATVGGGRDNSAAHDQATVGGGQLNRTNGAYAAIAGGGWNFANEWASIGGGRGNSAGPFATVPGGDANWATGRLSFAAGFSTLARDDGSFVWGDSRDVTKTSTGPNSFSVHASGGTRFFTSSISFPVLEVASNGSTRFFPTGVYTTTPSLIVDTTGRVGIGVASPSDALQVRGSVALDLDQRLGWYPNGDTFGFNGKSMGHYTLGWFNDSWDRDGASAWISGYCGVRLFAGGAPRLNVNRWGNVGINTSTPQFTLEVNGSAGKPGGGAWSVSSDARLKKDVQPLEGALETLLALRGVSYEYKDPAAIHELPGRRIGFIAQQVEQVLPDWVEEGENGFKRLTIRGFEALAVEALRELESERDELAAQNAALAEHVAGLETRLARLEGALARLDEARF